jgi:hypothetical protein
MRTQTFDKQSIMGILFLGSLWGLLEATMGNILHWVGLHPGTGLIMTSIGLGFIHTARSTYKKRGIGIIMAVLAASIKALDFFVPGSNVIRPIIAILAIGVVYEAVALVTEKVKVTAPVLASRGFAQGYLSIAAFAYFTAYVIRFEYWYDKGFFGILSYLGAEGWKFALGGMFSVLTAHYLITTNHSTIHRWVNSQFFYRLAPITTIVAIMTVLVV